MAGNQSFWQTFRSASPGLSDPAALMVQVAAHPDSRPELVQSWQQYFRDTRDCHSHYMEGGEVGFCDGVYRDVVQHGDEVAACADFICRPATWVLERRQTGSATHAATHSSPRVVPSAGAVRRFRVAGLSMLFLGSVCAAAASVGIPDMAAVAVLAVALATIVASFVVTVRSGRAAALLDHSHIGRRHLTGGY
jgi:hypothetical protein